MQQERQSESVRKRSPSSSSSSGTDERRWLLPRLHHQNSRCSLSRAAAAVAPDCDSLPTSRLASCSCCLQFPLPLLLHPCPRSGEGWTATRTRTRRCPSRVTAATVALVDRAHRRRREDDERLLVAPLRHPGCASLIMQSPVVLPVLCNSAPAAATTSTTLIEVTAQSCLLPAAAAAHSLS